MNSSIKKSKIYTSDSIPDVTATNNPVTKVSMAQTLSKWIPLLCAGAAVGVSVIALKEIKNVRKDLIALNLQKSDTPGGVVDNSVLEKIKQMDTQLIKISEYLAKQQKQAKQVNQVVPPKKEIPQVLTKIINEEPVLEVKKQVPNPLPPTPPIAVKKEPEVKEDPEEEVEYIYEEVTDDEEEK